MPMSALSEDSSPTRRATVSVLPLLLGVLLVTRGIWGRCAYNAVCICNTRAVGGGAVFISGLPLPADVGGGMGTLGALTRPLNSPGGHTWKTCQKSREYQVICLTRVATVG